MSLNAKQNLQIASPKCVKCPLLSDVTETSSKVMSYTMTWQIFNTSSSHLSPSFHFGAKDEHEGCLKARTNQSTQPEQTRVKLSFIFITSVGKMLGGIIEFSLECTNGTTVSENFNLSSSQVLTFPDMLWYGSFDGTSCPCTINCELKLKEAVEIIAPKDHHLKMASDYSALLESATLADVTIYIKKHKLRVHKTILAARSPVFAAMFQTDMSEKRKSTITIEDISYNTMKKLISFIYTGNVPDLEDSAEKLMHAADKYGLDDLRFECGDFLSRNVNVENAARLLILGERHRHEELWKNAVHFAKRHRMEVIVTEDWKQIKRSNPGLLLELFMEK